MCHLALCGLPLFFDLLPSSTSLSLPRICITCRYEPFFASGIPIWCPFTMVDFHSLCLDPACVLPAMVCLFQPTGQLKRSYDMIFSS
ncbi:hypothetical protein F5878DRAFT_18441 [Lentinula raphanica]|uniref:Secreted protein n=1 Tax=Lentinula raphanica TaxID=153919 RepID=A0AA38U4K8_9AGAR|nr:hypothetical protein F5878DRAFT_18441 [Lentinula raphanica]